MHEFKERTAAAQSKYSEEVTSNILLINQNTQYSHQYIITSKEPVLKHDTDRCTVHLMERFACFRIEQ